MHADQAAVTFVSTLGHIIPFLFSVTLGYVLCVKLPFYFFLKVLRDAKGLSGIPLAAGSSRVRTPELDPRTYDRFLRRMRQRQAAEAQAQAEFERALEQERLRREQEKRVEEEELRARWQEERQRMQEEEEHRHQEHEAFKRAQRERREREREQRRQRNEEARARSRKAQAEPSASEDIFELGPDFNSVELKKRYYKLLKENHPDKFSHLGAEARLRAEARTKEINSAYERLKLRAA
jgi:hypothetical protein